MEDPRIQRIKRDIAKLELDLASVRDQRWNQSGALQRASNDPRQRELKWKEESLTKAIWAKKAEIEKLIQQAGGRARTEASRTNARPDPYRTGRMTRVRD